MWVRFAHLGYAPTECYSLNRLANSNVDTNLASMLGCDSLKVEFLEVKLVKLEVLFVVLLLAVLEVDEVLRWESSSK